MRKYTLFLLMLIYALVIFSCKKDEVDKTLKTGLITKVYTSGILDRTIEYNSFNRPIKMNFYTTAGIPNGYSSYDFGNDSLIDKVSIYNQQGVVTTYTTYIYDSLQRLSTKKYYQKQSSISKLISSEAFFYNSKNQLINHSYFDSTGNVKYFQEQIFDTLIDPSEIKYFKSDNTYAGSIFYTYDTKPNAFAKFQKSLGTSHPYNKCNITKTTSSLTPINGEVTFNLGNVSIPISLYSSTYEYDFNNLPTKEIRKYLNGTIESESYEYK